MVALQSSDPRYDATYLANYIKLFVVDELKRVPGVGDATPFPARDFSMLLQLDPEKMAQLGLTVSDVAAAVREQNATNPAGRLGAEPSPPGTQLTLPITTHRPPADAGRVRRHRRFARGPTDRSSGCATSASTVLGARSYDLEGRLNGVPTAFVLLYTRPGANALAVKEAVAKRMDELQTGFPPGIRWTIPFDTTPFVSASIHEVVMTLVEAMILVTLVVFLFLQSWRATLIPMLAVPVSVIGTFLGFLAFGMSINVLTLFGLVLAIGIVVDDAIVVIENVERIMASEGAARRALAADKAIRQVGSALVAIVLVLCAVFVPVAFIGGVTGELFKQFAITIVIAVVLSGIVALTLTPALCALLLTESNESAHHRLLRLVQPRLRARRRAATRARWTPSSAGRRSGSRVFLVFIALACVLWRKMPTAFIPTEDKGYMALSVQLPDAASLQRTDATVAQGREDPSQPNRPCVNIVALVGLNILSGGRTRPTAPRSSSISSRGTSAARTTRSIPSPRASIASSSPARRERVRLQPAGNPGLGHHGRRRDEPAEPQRPGHSRVRAARRGVPPGGEQAARRGADQQRSFARACRRST